MAPSIDDIDRNGLPQSAVVAAELPTRVLVQTATDLVPGAAYTEKMLTMLDRICQHQWGCDYHLMVEDFRWAINGAKFAYKNRRCYFLVDRGFANNDNEIRFYWYQWTGSNL
jgi:hypothetical protein